MWYSAKNAHAIPRHFGGLAECDAGGGGGQTNDGTCMVHGRVAIDVSKIVPHPCFAFFPCRHSSLNRWSRDVGVGDLVGRCSQHFAEGNPLFRRERFASVLTFCSGRRARQFSHVDLPPPHSDSTQRTARTRGAKQQNGGATLRGEQASREYSQSEMSVDRSNNSSGLAQVFLEVSTAITSASQCAGCSSLLFLACYLSCVVPRWHAWVRSQRETRYVLLGHIAPGPATF